MPRIRLLQLPIPPPAALAATGNVPLAAGVLKVAAEVHGLTDRGLEIEVMPPELTDTYGDRKLADHIAEGQPEFVGLSLYLWNVERSLHVAREIKARSPATQVIIGGPEVTSTPGFVNDALGYDIAVTGEAEDRFAQVMELLMNGDDPSSLPGVATRLANGKMGGFGAEPVADFPISMYPSPYVSGALAVTPKRSTYVETVRGCASSCTYCFYPRSSSSLRSLDVEQSASLLAGLRDRGAREVVFLDPTFNHRQGFQELLDAMIRVNGEGQLSFFAEVRPEGLTEKHAADLAAAGFTKLEIGLQSVNKETLKRVKRFGDPMKVAEAARMLRGQGIDLLVDLIIGLPNDTPGDVAAGVEFLVEHGLGDCAQVFPLCVLPGTAMRASAEEFGLVYDPAPPYRVIRAEGFDETQLIETLLQAEEALDRRLDEYPRLHLISADGTDPEDVLCVDLAASESETVANANFGARHVALWFRGDDLYPGIERIRSELRVQLQREPFGVLDVVLRPKSPFPFDLLEMILEEFDAATPSYLTRVLAHRGENLQRRIGVVLPRDTGFPESWVEALLEEVPVFQEQTLEEAITRPLGDDLPAALITDSEIDEDAWALLVRLRDAEGIAFASREFEARWSLEELRYDERS